MTEFVLTNEERAHLDALALKEPDWAQNVAGKLKGDARIKYLLNLKARTERLTRTSVVVD